MDEHVGPPLRRDYLDTLERQYQGRADYQMRMREVIRRARVTLDQHDADVAALHAEHAEHVRVLEEVHARTLDRMREEFRAESDRLTERWREAMDRTEFYRARSRPKKEITTGDTTTHLRYETPHEGDNFRERWWRLAEVEEACMDMRVSGAEDDTRVKMDATLGMTGEVPFLVTRVPDRSEPAPLPKVHPVMKVAAVAAVLCLLVVLIAGIGSLL